ncbi:flagellar motor switch phosphatase FliY [Peptoclostridium acidaminophilum DSM 3953]|uniref:Flagellar motor switch phosphatase FliY n=2 Tax=Peptoclostridium acidaminophilum TaxID=1731 RepID=W8T722_PEPAC|nr:flagellar motor switch phosphatase FliY [Peptoclostridium acidaminophilum DSM 3953]
MMNDLLSQDEIDALLKGASADETPSGGLELDEYEKDAIGEIGNINMGNSATTLSTILGKRVSITTPSVDVISIDKMAEEQPVPYVIVRVGYKEGLNGMNMLILKEDDVKVIASLMMGGDGKSGLLEELNDIHLSAISEAMNQMVGSSSTSLSEMIGKRIDINPPEVFKVNLMDNSIEMSGIDKSCDYVRVLFKMTIEDLIDSNIMQLMPIDFARDLINNMLYGSESQESEDSSAFDEPQYNTLDGAHTASADSQRQSDRVEHEEQAHHAQSAAIGHKNTELRANENHININPAKFESFDEQDIYKTELPENIEIIKDVFLKVTVELGRTARSIDEILAFGPGTVIELEKLVGEPLDVLVNGKRIAKGEVVVIDENYGIRITDIIKPDKRLRSI